MRWLYKELGDDEGGVCRSLLASKSHSYLKVIRKSCSWTGTTWCSAILKC